MLIRRGDNILKPARRMTGVNQGGHMPGGDVAQCMQTQADQLGFTLDASQRAAVDVLQQMYGHLLKGTSPFFPARVLRRLIRTAPVRGIYLYGGVGRGKSFVMNTFFACVPLAQKRRVHFHYFMRDIHARLAALKGRANPLTQVSRDLSHGVRLLCLDEFHIADIADAMLIRGLLQGLFDRGVAVVMTSNSEPDALYLNGLQRTQFLPTIALIKECMDRVHFASDMDYRLKLTASTGEAPIRSDAQSEQTLPAVFWALVDEGGEKNTRLQIEGRTIVARGHDDGVAWFDFNELCAGARGKADYRALASRFHTIFLSGVLQFDQHSLAQARRFMWLVDELYDHGVKLIFPDAAPTAHFGHASLLDGEFQRVLSRLAEMRSHAYLAKPVNQATS